MCSYHNVPWHIDETCEQYDARVRPGIKKSEKAVVKISKICPSKGCRRRIDKDGGCNHMTCMFDFLTV